ncbi:MAG: hypothetical protein HQK60_03830 [Deltaproteobacteria bacterium]|nr:hypothetical protein [Deltaproteobacteria bacterium]
MTTFPFLSTAAIILVVVLIWLLVSESVPAEWKPFLPQLFVGIVALSVPYLRELIHRVDLAPRLKIDFEPNNPDCIETATEGTPSFFFRFRVRNSGRDSATNCEAVLERILKYDGGAGKYIDHPNFTTPVNMKWVGTSDRMVLINPRRKVFCGLMNSLMIETGKEFELNYDDIPIVQHKRLGSGKYLIYVAIYSTNSAVARRVFSIDWGGEWGSDLTKMMEKIKIESMTINKAKRKASAKKTFS